MAEENKITAMKMINGLLAKSYKEAWEAKEKGIPGKEDTENSIQCILMTRFIA